MARSSHAACHCFLTVRRVGMVAARRSTALRLTRTVSAQSRSSTAPGLRGGRRLTSTPRSPEGGATGLREGDAGAVIAGAVVALSRVVGMLLGNLSPIS